MMVNDIINIQVKEMIYTVELINAIRKGFQGALKLLDTHALLKPETYSGILANT